METDFEGINRKIFVLTRKKRRKKYAEKNDESMIILIVPGNQKLK